jgi:hypothetical protein
MRHRAVILVLMVALAANLAAPICSCCPQTNGAPASGDYVAAATCCDGEAPSSCRPTIRQPGSVAIATAPTTAPAPTDLPPPIAIATAMPHVHALTPAHPPRTLRNGLVVLHAQLLI